VLESQPESGIKKEKEELKDRNQEIRVEMAECIGVEKAERMDVEKTIVAEEENGKWMKVKRLKSLDFRNLGDACDQQQDDEKRKAVIKISKLALKEMITVLNNEPRTKERIMTLEVERRIINKINKGMPWYLSLLQSALMTFDPGGSLFPVV
ncbi:7301_t:CDS:2, partial [Cetraspora pellucida]